MRTGTRLVMTIASTAVVAISFRISARPDTDNSSAIPTPVPTQSYRPARQSSPRPSSPAPLQTQRPTASSSTVSGRTVQTQYGPVRVEVTVRGRRIAKVTAAEHPSGDGQTDQINAFAVPALNQEAVAAQSARIDTVSGATYTSEGYRRSLQSALDAAHQAGAW